MAIVKRIVMILICGLLVVACAQREHIFLEKDGTLYEIGEQVSFYYPKDFDIDTSHGNKNKVRFIDEDEVIYFSTVVNQTENKVVDMPKLYAGQLEEDGASDVEYTQVILDSGIQCQSFTGIFHASGIKFKHIVYFTDDATYSYCYEAIQDIFDENVATRSEYLESLTVHHDRMTTLE